MNESRSPFDPLLRAVAAAALTAIAGMVILLFLSAGDDDGWWIAALIAIPGIATVVATLPRPRLVSYVLGGAAAVATMASVAGWDSTRDEWCDCSADHLFRQGVEATLYTALPALIPAGMVLTFQQPRSRTSETHDPR